MGDRKSDLLGKLTGALGDTGEKNTPAPSGSSGTSAEKSDSPPPSREAAGMGLNALELLNLPSDQRKVITWLSRKKQATFAEIEKALGHSPETLHDILHALQQANYINEALVDRDLYYRVVFRGTVRRKATGISEALWARVDLDHVTFLKQVALFKGLSDDEIRAIANIMGEHHYTRDEVMLWQGDVSDQMFFVKSGVVGISRFTSSKEQKTTLSYLKPGDFLGEYNVLLVQGGAASATVTALSSVTALTLKKADFLELAHRHPSIALELARELVHRLVAQNMRLGSAHEARISLVVGVGQGVGCTTVGSMLAMTLAHVTGKSAVYTELPNPDRMARLFSVSTNVETHRMDGGFDLVIKQDSPGLPPTVRATMTYDYLIQNYENVVVGLRDHDSDLLDYLAEQTDQIVLVTSPNAERVETMRKLESKLRNIIHPEKVILFEAINRTSADQKDVASPVKVEFDLPYVTTLPALAAQTLQNRPEALAQMTNIVADRLGRANSISVYIPSTIDVSTPIDTQRYVEKTLDFMGDKFGGATLSKARGVWNSADAGLVGEDITIVRSYATQSDLDQHLQSILDYVEALKSELRQEAMAVEINQKLMLI